MFDIGNHLFWYIKCFTVLQSERCYLQQMSHLWEHNRKNSRLLLMISVGPRQEMISWSRYDVHSLVVVKWLTDQPACRPANQPTKPIDRLTDQVLSN